MIHLFKSLLLKFVTYYYLEDSKETQNLLSIIRFQNDMNSVEHGHEYQYLTIW